MVCGLYKLAGAKWPLRPWPRLEALLGLLVGLAPVLFSLRLALGDPVSTEYSQP